jgi:hypothetical protein
MKISTTFLGFNLTGTKIAMLVQGLDLLGKQNSFRNHRLNIVFPEVQA